MLIGIDANEANVARRVGIGEYAFELLWQFSRYQKSDIRFQIYLKDPPLSHMPEQTQGWKYVLVKPGTLWTQIGLPLYLYMHLPRPDVFFTPSHYAPRMSPVPTVISIMDLSYIHFPELFAKKDLYQLQNWTKYSAKHATKVFTISQASKNDILHEYQKASEDVIVTYPGIRAGSYIQRTTNMKELEKKFGIKGNYILFVGTLQPRKNIARLIEAFGLVVQHKGTKDVELVIVGKKGWLYDDILQAPRKFAVEEKVKFLDFVSDEDLPGLYQHALCYVLPSLYEGFGLPVLEAMQYGTPVITSNVSSLPEAGGDAAVYVDPTNTKDIASKIQTVITDKNLRADMSKKGFEHIKKFSWEKAAKQTLEVLEEVGRRNI